MKGKYWALLALIAILFAAMANPAGAQKIGSDIGTAIKNILVGAGNLLMGLLGGLF